MPRRHRRAAGTISGWVVTGLITGVLGVGASGCARGPSAVEGVRLYVLDGGTLIYNNPVTYNFTRQEVRNTNMPVPCYLIVHPQGTLVCDPGLRDAWGCPARC